jgi:hypothetical protein
MKLAYLGSSSLFHILGFNNALADAQVNHGLQVAQLFGQVLSVGA